MKLRWELYSMKRDIQFKSTQDKWTTCPLDAHSLSKTKSFNKFIEFDVHKGFCKTIGQLFVSGDIFGSNCPITKFFTDKEVAKLDMLAMLQTETIFDKQDHSLIVKRVEVQGKELIEEKSLQSQTSF